MDLQTDLTEDELQMVRDALLPKPACLALAETLRASATANASDGLRMLSLAFVSDRGSPWNSAPKGHARHARRLCRRCPFGAFVDRVSKLASFEVVATVADGRLVARDGELLAERPRPSFPRSARGTVRLAQTPGPERFRIAVEALLELPLYGLLSELPFERVVDAIREVTAAAAALGCTMPEPFSTLGFVGLPVEIGELRVVPEGLVHVASQRIVPLLVDGGQ